MERASGAPPGSQRTSRSVQSPSLDAFAEQGSEGKNKFQPRKAHEPESQTAPAELLPACYRGEQKNPLPLCLGKRVRAGESPPCEITKNAASPSEVQSKWSSPDLSRRNYRCRTTDLRRIRPRGQPPSRLRYHDGFRSLDRPSSQPPGKPSNSENPAFRKKDQSAQTHIHPPDHP